MDAPERMARREGMSRREVFCMGEGLREGAKGIVSVRVGDVEEGEAIRGVSALWSLLSVLEETPASVSSPNEPRKRAMPCCRMTTETSRPEVMVKSTLKMRMNVTKKKLHAPPRGSKGKAGNHHVPRIATNATALVYASLRW
jgi:hypothetical protein